MTDPLRRYLSEQNEGRRHSGGEFTLDPEAALRKMADYSLPFAGCWAVKVVQFVVASGSRENIVVCLERRKVTFSFQLGVTWTLEEVEAQLLDPRNRGDRALYHLAQAFWAAAIGEERRFRLRLQGQSQSWEWDGELRRLPCEVVQECRLELSRSASPASADNADLLKALSERCFTCPAPLLVDGRRLDALQRCPRHGWERLHHPLFLGFAETEIPDLSLPPFTFDFREGALRKGIPDGLLQELPRRDAASLACQVSFHRKQSLAEGCWPAPTASQVHWVSDGVVVLSEKLPLNATACAMGLYLSAEGLVTDATGFGLLEQLPKDERLERGASAAAKLLVEVGELRFQWDHDRSSGQKTVAGTLGLLLGAGFVFVSKFMALYLIGLALNLARDKSHLDRGEEYKAAFEEFKFNWIRRYGACEAT